MTSSFILKQLDHLLSICMCHCRFGLCPCQLSHNRFLKYAIDLLLDIQCTCSIGEYDCGLIFIHFPQNGKIMSDEKPFREPQFPRLPVSYLATLLS